MILPATQPAARASTEGTLRPWTAAERESFFDAIARNQRDAARLTILGWFCSAVIAFVVAILFAPFVCAIGVLASDLVNLVHPIPDPLKLLVGYFSEGRHALGALPAPRWTMIGMLLAAPGLLFMGLVIGALHRALHGSAALSGQTVSGRQPDPTVLAEQRLVNVVTELSLAAAIPVPAIRISPAPVANALVMGEGPARCILIVTQPLLDCLNREELQGAIAHLIGSVADGDLAIGIRSTIHALLFDLVRRLGDGRSCLRSLRQLIICAFRPHRIDAAALIADIEEQQAARRQPDAPEGRSRAERGSWLTLAVAGPVLLPGFVAGLVAALLLRPLLSLAWRRRKFMADATAVRLTRDANALAGALQHLDRGAPALALPFANDGGTQSVENWVEYFAKNPHQAGYVQRQIERSTRALEAMPTAMRANPQFAELINRGLAQRQVVVAALEQAKSIPQVAAALAARSPTGGELPAEAEEARAALPAYAAHLALLTSNQSPPLLDSLVSSIPPIDKRLRALAAVGAQLQRAPRQIPLGFRIFATALYSIFGLLMTVVVVLLVYVAAALSGMFTIIPTLLIHALLRWLGGHSHFSL